MSNEAHHLKPALDEQGLNASPQLPDGVKNYLIDIDGTITEDVPTDIRAWPRASRFQTPWKR